MKFGSGYWSYRLKCSHEFLQLVSLNALCAETSRPGKWGMHTHNQNDDIVMECLANVDSKTIWYMLSFVLHQTI